MKTLCSDMPITISTLSWAAAVAQQEVNNERPDATMHQRGGDGQDGPTLDSNGYVVSRAESWYQDTACRIVKIGTLGAYVQCIYACVTTVYTCISAYILY